MGEDRVTGADGNWRGGRGRRWPPKIGLTVPKLMEGSWLSRKLEVRNEKCEVISKEASVSQLHIYDNILYTMHPDWTSGTVTRQNR